LLSIDVKLPEGFHLNPNAPHRYELNGTDGAALKIDAPAGKFAKLPLKIPFRANASGVLRAKLTFYYCREDNTGVCLIKTLVWNVPLKVAEGGGGAAPTVIELKDAV
jgi:hypothetical protein